MLIKTKLTSISVVQVVLLSASIVLVALVFDRLAGYFGDVVEITDVNVNSASQSADELSTISTSLSKTSLDMMQTVEKINVTRKQTNKARKKVRKISRSLESLTKTIDDLSNTVTDEASKEIINKINADIGEISKRLKGEALDSINKSYKEMKVFSKDIDKQAFKVSIVNASTKELVEVNETNRDNSYTIQEESKLALGVIKNYQNIIIATLLVITLISIAACIIIFLITIKPINRTINLMKDIAEGEGDLTQRLESKGNDEMAMIANIFNLFLEKIQKFVIEVNTSANAVNESSNVTHDEMEQVSNVIQEQLYQTEQIASSIEQLSASSENVAQKTVEAKDVSITTNKHSTDGKKKVDDAYTSTKALAETMAEATKVIDLLSEKSTTINKVVDMIQAVTEQTGLLALNAAIEAARAGEQGRGFAVVADEVRGLAAKTEEGSGEIRVIVDEIQKLTNDVVSVIQSSKTLSTSTVDDASSASEALNAISSSIGTIDTMTTDIAATIEEQKEASSTIKNNIFNIKELTSNTSKGVDDTLENCKSLNKISNNLKVQLQQFKV